MLDAIHQDLLNGNAAAAEQKARELLAQRPKDSEVYRVLAAAQSMAGNPSGAQATIADGLAALPDDPALNFAQAGLYLEAQDAVNASAQLGQVIKLDPNFFPAYVLQADLAMSQGQVEEAERIARVANRVSPDHPQLLVIMGQVALAKGEREQALEYLTAAAQQMPGDPRVMRSLGLAYMANDHAAFAEQTFRNLLEKDPQADDVRAMLVDSVRMQGRNADAFEIAQPMIHDDTSPQVLGNVGIIAMDAGKTEQGVDLLERTVRMVPGEQQPLAALVNAWDATGQRDRGRAFLDGLLDADPHNSTLWQARLALEEFAGDAATGLIDKWLAAMPESLEAMQARAVVYDVNGELAKGDDLSRRMIEIQPLHADAQVRLLNRLMQTDPEAAVTRSAELKEIFKGKNGNVEAYLRGLHTATLNLAGRYQEAVDEWLAIQAEVANTRLPLPKPGTPRSADEWTALQADEPLAGASPSSVIGGHHQLLFGPPGSLAEFIGYSLGGAGVPLLADRFSEQPPNDFLQSYAAIEMLDKDAPANIAAGGEIIGKMAAEWNDNLARRGAPAATPVVDAMLLWDNNFLQVLRAHPMSTQVMMAIRDPRDMLLQWLAFPETMVYQFNSTTEAATWLAAICNQIADIAEHNLFPHRLVKLDNALQDEMTLSTELSNVLGTPVSPLDNGLVQGKTFAPGHWRQYQPLIGDAFDLLKGAAVRLGYPEA